MSFSRAAAVDRLRSIVERVETEAMPVAVREVWTFGDVVLGTDPVERLDVYLAKDLLFSGDTEREAEFEERLGVSGIGKTVSAAWAEAYPEYVRANANGHVAPERCLAAHLLEADEPVHLEVCNTGFERNVTQRLEGARARDDYSQLLDPRGVCLWIGESATAPRDGRAGDAESHGQRSHEAFRKLERGEFVFPTLGDSLEMLGMEEAEANDAADTLDRTRRDRSGVTVRGDVV